MSHIYESIYDNCITSPAYDNDHNVYTQKNNDCDYEDDVGRKREAEGELRSNVWSVNSATARCC